MKLMAGGGAGGVGGGRGLRRGESTSSEEACRGGVTGPPLGLVVLILGRLGGKVVPVSPSAVSNASAGFAGWSTTGTDEFW